MQQFLDSLGLPINPYLFRSSQQKMDDWWEEKQKREQIKHKQLFDLEQYRKSIVQENK